MPYDVMESISNDDSYNENVVKVQRNGQDTQLFVIPHQFHAPSEICVQMETCGFMRDKHLYYKVREMPEGN